MKYFNVLTGLILFFSSQSVMPQTLLEAVNNNNIEIVNELIKNSPSSITEKDQRGKTPLLIASEKGFEEITKELLLAGADADEAAPTGTTPLHFAAFGNYVGIVKLLIQHNAKVDIKNNQQVTPLYYAAMKGNDEVVKYLLENNAFVDSYDRENGTPLHSAALNGHFKMVKILIEKDADIEHKDINGLNALHFACRGGKVGIVKLLSALGMDAGGPDIYGRTPFYYALAGGFADVVNELVMNDKLNYMQKSLDGSNYLHASVTGGLKDAVILLIEKGVDPNSKNEFGISPLDIAIQKNINEIAEILIQSGATAKDKNEKLIGEYFGETKPGLKSVLFAPGIVSTYDSNERDVTFNLSQTEIYFTRWPSQKGWEIMTAENNSGEWTNPHPASFSSDFHDAEACFTQDNKQIYFISNRLKEGESRPTSWEIYFTSKIDTGWSEPKMLGGNFIGGFYPTFTKTGRMYFTASDNNIHYSDLIDGKYVNSVCLSDSVNTNGAEYNSLIAPDESFLIFSSDGWGEGFGSGDLFISFRNEEGSWTRAKNMGPAINSHSREYCPALSPDGKYFFFSSRRLGTENIYWIDAEIIEKLKED